MKSDKEKGKLGFYELLRYTKAYEFLAKLRNTGYYKEYKNDLIFFDALFKKIGIKNIFDIGANDGVKTRVFLELGQNVVSVEPDPFLVNIIDYRFRNNKKLKIEENAVGDAPGELTFFKKNYSGFNTLSKKWSEKTVEEKVVTVGEIKVSVTTLDSLIGKHGVPDYVKIDVEGFEINVIKGLSRTIPLISFESNLPFFMEETKDIISILISRNQGVVFNFRKGSSPSFSLKENVGGEDIVEHLKKLGEATIDVFAFSKMV